MKGNGKLQVQKVNGLEELDVVVASLQGELDKIASKSLVKIKDVHQRETNSPPFSLRGRLVKVPIQLSFITTTLSSKRNVLEIRPKMCNSLLRICHDKP